MEKGTVIKAISGFFSVLLEKEKRIVVCRQRGKLKLTGERILVGDQVLVDISAGSEGLITEVLPRRNKLVRPPIANVDQVVVVMSVADPSPQLLLLDRILVSAHVEGLPAAIVLNKSDLAPEEAEALASIYRQADYPVITASCLRQQGLDALARTLKGRVTCLAGPSGVGKSSLLNCLQPGLRLETGQISSKLGRGKHTTRVVELINLDVGGLVADTPGFSSLSIDTPARNLAKCFPDISRQSENCWYGGCLHTKEEGCAVRVAVEKGILPPSRYQNYCVLLDELQEREKF